MTTAIIGAGLAGLLAARMLYRRGRIVVIEEQEQLPNNHSAVLRFRTALVGEVLGVPFKKVQVIKSVLQWKNQAADTLAYSMKCTGEYRTDRSLVKEVVERWIAPPDLVSRMAAGLLIKYGQRWDFSRTDLGKVVSTIPMPGLMRAMNYPNQPEFSYVDGFNVRAKVSNCDAYLSLYVPNPDIPFSRISITGNEMIVEFPNSPVHGDPGEHAVRAARILGLLGSITNAEIVEQRYSKISPIDDDERKAFIFWASSIKNTAFSLGRFATWRPGLLLDDVVNDVRRIEGWMNSRTPGYDMDMHKGRP